MRVMRVVNLSNVDWNLFLVLHTVLEEGSATKAAKRLSVTQSAVSNALARLRIVLDDPLVVRIGNQLVPTPKALALAPRIRTVVTELGLVLEREKAFDAATSTRRFVLAISDELELSLLAPLLRELGRHLPRTSLRATRLSAIDAANGLGTGEIDALVGMVESVPAGCAAEELFEDELVWLVRREHPLEGPRIAAASLVGYPRIGVESSLDVERAVDRVLAARSASSAPSNVVASFVAAAIALEGTDAVVAAPRRSAEALVLLFPVRILSVEPPCEALSVSLVWHARTDADPAASKLRELLRRAAKARGTGAGRRATGARRR